MESIPDATPIEPQLTPPENLIPKENGEQFPTLTREDYIELAKKGWDRVGIIVLLLNPDGAVLTVMHGPGDPKVKEGTLGVISETLTFDANAVEQPVPGISRLLHEELGLGAAELASLNLEAKAHGAWDPVLFPIPGDRKGLALVTVLRADEASADTLIKAGNRRSPRKEKIYFSSFMRPEPLAHGTPGVADKFREGTSGVVQSAMEQWTDPGPRTRVELPPPEEELEYKDIKDLLA